MGKNQAIKKYTNGLNINLRPDSYRDYDFGFKNKKITDKNLK